MRLQRRNVSNSKPEEESFKGWRFETFLLERRNKIQEYKGVALDLTGNRWNEKNV